MDNQEQEVYEAIKEIFLLLDDGDRHLFRKHNLSLPRYYALKHIDESPGLSPIQLSLQMFCDKSNITRILKGLEKDGLIERVQHEQDRRSIRIFLTEEGVIRFLEARRAHDAFNKDRLKFLNSSLDCTAMRLVLSTLQKGLQANKGSE